MPSETRSFASEDAAAWASRCAKNAAALSTAMLASSTTINTPVGTSSSTVPRSQSPESFSEDSSPSAITGPGRGHCPQGARPPRPCRKGSVISLARARTVRGDQPPPNRAIRGTSCVASNVTRSQRRNRAAPSGATEALTVEPVAGHRLRTCGDRCVHCMCGARSGVLDESPRGLPGTSDYGDLRIECRPGLGRAPRRPR